jgi:hypothetical protein
MSVYEATKEAMEGDCKGDNDLAEIAYKTTLVALRDNESFAICCFGQNGIPSQAFVDYDAYLTCATSDKFTDDYTTVFKLMLEIVAETVCLFKMLRHELLVNGSRIYSSDFDYKIDKLSTTEAILLVLGKLVCLSTVAPHCF